MSANDRQEGGTHYQQEAGVPQHWDLAILYGWDPFQYQITKYVMRWKDKHPTPEKKLEDLKKARHFLDKYIENFEKYLPPEPQPASDRVMLFKSDSNEQFQCEGWFGDLTQEYKCLKCRTRIRAESLEEVERLHHCAIPL